MKVIFLDIDGVLNCATSKSHRVEDGGRVINDIDSYRRENLAELERIINDTQSNTENLLQKAEVNSGGDDY